MQDENWRCFNNYLAFENYRRCENENIDQYLSEFDRRHYKLKECGVNLPDAVVACRLIKSCNLSEMHFQLALSTTPKMSFEDMRNTLKRLFAESGNNISSNSETAMPVKVENVKSEPIQSEAFYSEKFSKGRGDGNRRRTPFRRGPGNWQNPMDRNGRVTTCRICSSTMHWARFCPHARNSDNF